MRYHCWQNHWENEDGGDDKDDGEDDSGDEDDDDDDDLDLFIVKVSPLQTQPLCQSQNQGSSKNLNHHCGGISLWKHFTPSKLAAQSYIFKVTIWHK